jgi:hypothetical protein
LPPSCRHGSKGGRVQWQLELSVAACLRPRLLVRSGCFCVRLFRPLCATVFCKQRLCCQDSSCVGTTAVQQGPHLIHMFMCLPLRLCAAAEHKPVGLAGCARLFASATECNSFLCLLYGSHNNTSSDTKRLSRAASTTEHIWHAMSCSLLRISLKAAAPACYTLCTRVQQNRCWRVKGACDTCPKTRLQHEQNTCRGLGGLKRVTGTLYTCITYTSQNRCVHVSRPCRVPHDQDSHRHVAGRTRALHV